MPIRNQAYLRRKNKEDIIKLLREKSRSYSDIARVLKLSNTAIAKIADDLMESNLILRESDLKGRTGIALKINENFGYIVAVDLSGKIVQICAADMDSKILIRRNICGLVNFQRKDFDDIVKIISEIMNSEELKEKKLCCISVATPGKMNECGEFILNPRFKGFDNFSIKKALKDIFKCDVVMKNDVKLAMEGEVFYGNICKGVSNAFMIHIDVGTGSALFLNGKIYEGTHGFAGEIGYFKLDNNITDENDYSNLKYSNYFDSLSLYSILEIVRRDVKEESNGYLKNYIQNNKIEPYNISINAMIDAYVAKDKTARKAVNSAAKVLGSVIFNIAEFLDIDLILINGAAIDLGNDFLQEVSNSAKGKRIEFSSLLNDTTIMGAINAGIIQTFDNNI